VRSDGSAAPSQGDAVHAAHLNASVFDGKAEKLPCRASLRHGQLGRSKESRHMTRMTLQLAH
jgi:hypothetical protein